MNRSERRANAGRYRGYSVTATCERCGANLGLTAIIETGEPDPSVTFLHNPDGSHEPVLSGRGMAARARREGRVLSTERRTLDA